MEKVLHLTLKKKWFDMIASGEKKEEYREIKDYWRKRLTRELDLGAHYALQGTMRKFTHVEFRNGYSKNAPKIKLVLNKISVDIGHFEWGAEPGQKYYVISLGSKS